MIKHVKQSPASDSDAALDADAWAKRALHLLDSGRLSEAIDANERALALDPENITAVRVGIRSRMLVCDWSKREEDKRWIRTKAEAGVRPIAPFFHRALSDSEAEHFLITRLGARGGAPDISPLWRGERYRHDKIRIAYVSTDFRDHVVADVLAGCFEHHDKSRFETVAISLGPDDGSRMRKRLGAAFDRFIDVQAMGDAEVAMVMREMEVDIAIDLNGYSGAKRTGILARRPAPVQVNYLGFPGTMNASFMDYIIADQIVIPRENQIHYSEKVVYLPHTYFPVDRTRLISENVVSRTDAGLPETGFVFACHNSPYKITPEMFDIWMRLLRSVEGSVLWLKSVNAIAMLNLSREAKARGIAPERIVFARRVKDGADHLARMRLADLFLDTQPYNAHATAHDALRVGLPVLTCLGNTFPARVAASLLHAIGLPELVTTSLAEYEALALTLAKNPDTLAAIKAKLIRNRDTEPLFDTESFTRYLEAAYTTMWQRQQAGLPPTSFIVPGAL